jgi:hypothetical protein
MTYIYCMKIIRTQNFDKDLKRIGGTDVDFNLLVEELSQNPDAGAKKFRV